MDALWRDENDLKIWGKFVVISIQIAQKSDPSFDGDWWSSTWRFSAR